MTTEKEIKLPVRTTCDRDTKFFPWRIWDERAIMVALTDDEQHASEIVLALNSAPALLAACEAAVKWHDTEMDFPLAKLRAAIKLAKGI